MEKTISFDCQGRTHKKKFYFVSGLTTKRSGGEVKPPEPLRKIIYPEFFENFRTS